MLATITKTPVLSNLIADSIVAFSAPAMKKQESRESARTVRYRLKELGSSTLHMLCLGAIALLMLLPVVGWAAPIDTWHFRNPLPQGHGLKGVVYGNNTFVAVGDNGAIVASPDAVNWTTSASGTTSQLRGVAHGNGTFVAVGLSGTVVTSFDGITWTTRASGTTKTLNGVTYGNNTFVAVGLSGTVVTSFDGITWTPAPSLGETKPLYGVAYGNSTFVAVGGALSGIVFTSADSATWVERTSGSINQLSAITYDNSTFVAVGSGGTVLTSPNGTSWSPRASGTTKQLSGVTYGNAIFLAVGASGTFLTSPDAVTWTQRASGTSNLISGVTCGSGSFVAVGEFGTILTSPEGISWTQRNSGTSKQLRSVTHGNDTFVAVGESGIILTSPDAITWTPKNSGVGDLLYGVTYGNDTFVAVGEGEFGIILTSPDGATWAPRNSGVKDPLYGITYGNDTFVAVGESGIILTSPDGATWAQRDSGSTDGLYGITYGNGTFVAVSNSGLIFTSPNGATWSMTDPGLEKSNALYAVTYGNNIFVAVGSGGTVLTSPEGATWTQRNSGTTSQLKGIAYGNGTFVAVGDSGTIVTSFDGTAWTKREPGFTDSFEGITFGNETFVAVGQFGAIIQSDVMPPPVNGQCGSSNDGTFTQAPTTDLCTAGTPSAVTGIGPWSWSCAGANGGTNAGCQANLQTWTVTPSAGANGTISPASALTVWHGHTTTFIVTPAPAYTATVGGTCGGSPASATAPFTYTTNPIIANCSVVVTFATAVNGQCGLANGTTVTSAPTTNLCAAGTPSAVTGTGPWTWSCQGINDGTTAPCQANLQTWTVTPSAGANGTISPSNAQTVNNGATTSFTVTPAAGYSATIGGTCGGSPVSGTAQFTYTTNAITANCTVVATFTFGGLPGVCGSANGTTVTSAPTTNLCATGTASAVTGSGPWIWTCQGAGGTVQCQANPETWTVTSSVTGGNGTISCTSPVNHGLASTCTITPNKGYRLGTLTDSGSNVAGQAVGNVYTIPTVTTNHAVIASFVTRGPVILWRNISTGENSVWYMDGSTHTGTAALDPLPGAWRMVATADFNNDGEADILWRNFTTGATMVWYMNGVTHTGSADIAPLTDLNWKIVGAADFDSNGTPDILWRNISTGASMVWYMNGVTRTGSADLTLVTDQDWKITGAQDVNNDGKPDIVWRNSTTGQNVVWYMEGIKRTGFAFLDSVTDQNWKMIVGAADVDNDGKLDILWRNSATGANMVWYMTDLAATVATLGAVADQNMEMAGQGNYSAAPPVNGQCGSANGGTFTQAPTTSLCAAGTPSAVTGSGPWTWSCAGTNGGTNASCQANQAILQTWTVTPSAGANGSISPSNAQTVNNGATTSFTVAPGAGYNAAVGGTCGGTLTGTTYTTNAITADCTVVATFTFGGLPGACGSANGGTFTQAPTINLCAAGTPSGVTGSGPWIWTCQGAGGTVQCQANPETWTVTSSVTGGNGTISCTSPVNHGLASTCTITPNKGYRLGTLTDSGSNVAGQAVGNVYTIPTVTTNHAVIASFVTRGPVILWRNISTGENSVWYMDGSTHTGTAALDPLPGAWRMVATADFNNDGEKDILWRNFTTGATMVWYMNGVTRTGSADIAPLTDLNWKIVGAADFDSNGTPDILWRNISTGANMVWYMNGVTRTGLADLTLVTDQDWKITGAQDVNNDGKPDIVWRNSTTGQNVVWYMEGIKRTGFAFLDSVTDQNWKMIVGAADVDNDGKLDILWRNSATGANMVWYMNGIAATVATLGAVADQNMEMAGQGNYSAAPPVNGQCGSANGTAVTSAPTTNLCAAGTPSAVTGSGPWTWSCAGTNGGTNASCQANQAILQTWTVTPSAGANGSISPSNAQTVNNGATTSFTVTPGAGYNAAVGGTCGGSPASGTASFTYTTNAITANCTVVTTFTFSGLPGACGSANGGTFTQAPTINLCAAGTPSGVTGSGPWIWTCQGAGGTVQCQANPETWTVTASVTGGNGTISCTSPVNHGLASTCTITPNKGYRLGTLTDSGSNVAGQAVGNVYTIPTVTTNHAVIASFVTRGPVILWRNISTGENSVWYMDGSTHTGTAALDPLPGAWRMVATADFNNDGEKDILWRNFTTGATMVWYMNGVTRTGSADIAPLTDLNWKIVGAADFDSNGTPDILWRNISTGANMVWYMNGVTRTGSADLTLVTDQDWKITGAQDVNNDGKPDIVWRNSTTGQNVVWYMEGIKRTGFAFLDSVTDQNWKMIVGAADVDNDGKLDILWRNSATGANMVWYMTDLAATVATLGAVADQNMEMAGQGNN